MGIPTHFCIEDPLRKVNHIVVTKNEVEVPVQTRTIQPADSELAESIAAELEFVFVATRSASYSYS